MALDTTTSVGEHLQPRRPSNFNTALRDAFTIFMDFEYEAVAANRRLWWFRKSGGTYAYVDTSGRIVISDFVSSYTFSALTLTTGRYLLVATWDNTTLSVRATPVGGAEASGTTTSFNPGSASARSPGVAWGTRESDVAVPTIHCAAAWDSVLGDNHLDSLLGLYPANMIPVTPFWLPGWGSEGDYGTNRTAASPADYQAAITGGPTQNIAVLKDPETHAPIDFSGTYYAIGNDGGEATLELYSSTNLTTWSYVEDITTAGTESLTAIGACDFIYDAGAARPYQAVYWGESAGDNDVYSISTASMSARTWTNETNNPIFLASDVSGHATSNGPEDCRFTKDDGGVWVMLFEHNNESPGNVVGIASNAAARFADAYTYQGDMFDGAVTPDVTQTASDIYANPAVCKFDGWYWAFFENRVGVAADSNLTVHSRSKTPADPESWIPLGFAAAVDGLESTSDAALFPNCATVESGKIRLYCTNNKKYVYEGLDQIYVPGMASPFAGDLLINVSHAAADTGSVLSPGAGEATGDGGAVQPETGAILPPVSGAAVGAGGNMDIGAGQVLSPESGAAAAAGGAAVWVGETETHADVVFLSQASVWRFVSNT